jgi:hypothetical protein
VSPALQEAVEMMMLIVQDVNHVTMQLARITARIVEHAETALIVNVLQMTAIVPTANFAVRATAASTAIVLMNLARKAVFVIILMIYAMKGTVLKMLTVLSVSVV